MRAQEFEGVLITLIEHSIENALDLEVCDVEIQVESFAQAGIMGTDNGLVIRVGDDEFQCTIVQSR